MKKMQKVIQCELCPKYCVLREYERGFCRVRINIEGKLYLLTYGLPCAAHVDPIEKKPIFHMLPASKSFSIATVGCCLDCRFCQNWEISQGKPEFARTYNMPPEKVIKLAKKYSCRSISFTYTEPTVFYEYMYDTAKLAKAQGLKTVFVTCGYINEKPARELSKVIDAANIDLKGYSEKYYKEVCAGELKPVLKCIEIMKNLGVLVEITNLIVPTLNDDLKMIERMCKFVAENYGKDTPLHFSAFYPAYKLKNLPRTSPKILKDAYDIARSFGLYYVYTGNVRIGKGTENTFCPKCSEMLIERYGYVVASYKIKDGKCPSCNTKIYGIWK